MTKRTIWQLDPAHTAVEFAVRHMMFTTVRGRFGGVSGTIEADEANADDSRVYVEIDAASIDTGVEDRDTHLRSSDFLDVENHPRIRFRSRRIEGADFEEGASFRIVGDLTIRGATREVTLEATFEGQGKDPWGGWRAGFNARAEIDRREWGLDWNQALEAGGVLVGNAVIIDIDAQAVKQEAAKDSATA